MGQENDLGGEDFDARIIDYLADEFKKENGSNKIMKKEKFNLIGLSLACFYLFFFSLFMFYFINSYKSSSLEEINFAVVIVVYLFFSAVASLITMLVVIVIPVCIYYNLGGR